MTTPTPEEQAAQVLRLSEAANRQIRDIRDPDEYHRAYHERDHASDAFDAYTRTAAPAIALALVAALERERRLIAHAENHVQAYLSDGIRAVIDEMRDAAAREEHGSE